MERVVLIAVAHLLLLSCVGAGSPGAGPAAGSPKVQHGVGSFFCWDECGVSADWCEGHKQATIERRLQAGEISRGQAEQIAATACRQQSGAHCYLYQFSPSNWEHRCYQDQATCHRNYTRHRDTTWAKFGDHLEFWPCKLFAQFPPPTNESPTTW